MHNTNQVPLVTVVMLSYNDAGRIGASIKSILEQEFSDFELIIIDNASSDSSMQVASSFFDDERIRVVVNARNFGQAYSLNLGFSQARGKYVAIATTDDIWSPTKLLLQVNTMIRNPNMGAIFTAAKGSRDPMSESSETWKLDDSLVSYENKSRAAWLLQIALDNSRSNPLNFPTALINLEVYKSIGPWDPKFRQLLDVEMWTRLISASEITVLQETLVTIHFPADSSNVSGATLTTLQRRDAELYQVVESVSRSLVSLGSEAIRDAMNELRFSPVSERFGRCRQFDLAFILLTHSRSSVSHAQASKMLFECVGASCVDAPSCELDLICFHELLSQVNLKYLSERQLEREQLIDMYTGSMSWKVTAPLRLLTEFILRLNRFARP